MSEQTEAQRLAEMNENKGNRLQPFIEDNEFTEFGYRPEGLRQEQSDLFASAAELRRLETVNKQLLEALEKMVAIHDEPSGFAGKYGKALNAAIEQQKIKIDERLGIARAAIAAAKGEA